MTVTTTKIVWCDEEGCDATYSEAVSTNQKIREMARERGWACHSDGDYCQTHNTK